MSSLSLPSPEHRAKIIEKFTELIDAIEAHPAWSPPNPHKGLFHVWDYVNRSRSERDVLSDPVPEPTPPPSLRAAQVRARGDQAGGTEKLECGRSTETDKEEGGGEPRKKEEPKSLTWRVTLPGVPGSSGPDAAAESFVDVCGRSATVNEMIANTKLLTMIGLPQVDYGNDIVLRSQAVVDVLKQAI
ncbi:hypothetical protein CMEL01_16074 [Colletotrichum melonis]|uniref:Uncharacterized protein n=1 Tax=Colletotrichum melonis TaxID=1209925 RepID=A0AAI9UHD4_9PEZI|nr:hypothetical protein CMEL01_16074 [Colletotrichum melonis]